MENLPLPLPPNNSRLGFYYYPDTRHFRQSDLNAWLPELGALGASWLTLLAPTNRAVPEYFLRGLLSSGIEPILHFVTPVDLPPPIHDMRLLFQTYARWGVHYISLFDRPNARASWSPSAWTQSNLVERFLDFYLPLANAAQEAGLIPVFPPLEPGGDYWDTAFLKASLQGIQRRGCHPLLKQVVLGAYAWTEGRSLNWGLGGPERWPAARPYYTPPGSEDQRGFRIFDWYLTLARGYAEESCHILLLGGGARLGDEAQDPGRALETAAHVDINLAVAALMKGTKEAAVDYPDVEPVPQPVLACNYWLLAASAGSPNLPQAWFRPDGSMAPAVGALRQWASRLDQPAEGLVAPFVSTSPPAAPKTAPRSTARDEGRWIDHYLLLPSYEWGVSDWHLDVIRPFVKKHRPTVGFSLEEAKRASRVTVVGEPQSFSQTSLRELLSAGCTVQHIVGDGTTIATQLEQL